MAIKRFGITDTNSDPQQQLSELDSGQLGAADCRITKRTLHGGLRDGVDVVRMENGRVKLDVIPTRGMGLWKAWLGDLEFGWKSPVRGPVHPAFVPLSDASGLGWLEGFDELLVRCGLESNGAPEYDEAGRLIYPLHGRIANKPAHLVTAASDSDAQEISLTGVVEEIRFHFMKLRMTSTVAMKAGEAGFRIHDEIENLSGSPAGMQILYHTNFGLPLLDAGSRLVAPIKMVIPRNERAAEGIKSWDAYAAPEPGFEEQVYFIELAAAKSGDTQVLLKNAHGNRGVSMFFNTLQLPCFTVWKNTIAESDGYVTGLEPGTNYPNPRSFEGEQNRVAKIAPGGKVVFDLRVELHDSAAEIEQAEAAINALQEGAKPQVYDKPQPKWCVP